MQKFIGKLAATITIFIGCVVNVHADVLPLDGSWHTLDEFFNARTGTFSTDFTFTGPATLNVTDLYVVGDSFKVYDFGTLVLTTPGVPFTTDPFGPTFQSDPALAFVDPNFSHGSVVLGAGAHDITIYDQSLPPNFNDGTVSVSAVSSASVPEPSSFALLGLGALGLAVRAYRRRQAAV